MEDVPLVDEDERRPDRSSSRAVPGPAAWPARGQFASAAERNSQPILDVLRMAAPKAGRALEIASGTGQHVCAFARAFPEVSWQPSDPDAGARDSIAAWTDAEGLANVAAPLALDVTRPGWHESIEPGLDLVVCINMIHIAPWAACEGLLAGTGRLLRAGGLLYLYGPYRRGGRHTAPSNAAFDRSLRAANADWGVRDVEEVVRLAAGNGLALERIVEMPANNLSVLFRRGDRATGDEDA